METQKTVMRFTRFVKYFALTLLKLIIFIIGHDILLYKQNEARTNALARREAQRRMNEFLSIASHELKTPLTSIKGNIQLMGRRLKSSMATNTLQSSEVRSILTELRELLERTDQQITRLTNLVNNLLESSRIHANTMELLYELCELDTITREILQDTRYIPPNRTVHVEFPEEKTLLILADANRIKQVIIHYLSNAHKYSEIDHPIEVALQEEEKMVRFSVRDRGPGIPLTEQQRVWECFYRVPAIEVKNGSEVGLGLGLHISRIIIEQHKGQVGLQSKAGFGSTFWFKLPLLQSNMNTVKN